jgi:hypothetical protein
MDALSLGRRSLLLTAGARAAFAQPAAQRVGFDSMAVGAPPTEFTTGVTGGGKPPRWVVIVDPSGHKMLAETSRDATDDRFPYAVRDGVTMRDGAVSTRFRAVEGRVDQAAGVVLRFIDGGNYYVARANALEGNVRLYRVVRGRREQFAGANARVLHGQWHVLSLRAEGERFSVALDGKTLYSGTDGTFREAGRVGLWTK